MKTQGQNISKEKADISVDKIIDCAHENITPEFLQELVDYRDGHLAICKKSEKEFLHSQFNFLLVLAFTIFSAFPVSPIHWVVFATGLIMLYATNNKRVSCKIDYNINHNLHLVSEEVIKRGRETLYGIS